MDLLLRALSLLLLLAGVPTFFLFGVVIGSAPFIGPPPGESDNVVPKVFMLYAAFPLAGLVSAAGGIL